MAKASALLLSLLSFGFFVVTYNLLTLILHNRSGVSNSDGSPLLDPIVQMPQTIRKAKNSPAPFHVALTATNATYNKRQCRIIFIIGINRRKIFLVQIWEALLASCVQATPDNLMDEIPTFVVDPLPTGVDRGYVVLNRPWAFVQWLERATTELMFHCIGCAHKSEMFGFVKDVFVFCAKSWGLETLIKELDCVRMVFQRSDDVKGKALYLKSNEMVKKLESKQISPLDASNFIIQFFNYTESVTYFSYLLWKTSKGRSLLIILPPKILIAMKFRMTRKFIKIDRELFRNIKNQYTREIC